MAMSIEACEKPTIAFIGDYVPRRCGIATFTAELCEALAATNEASDVFVAALNDVPEGYPYPDRVRFEIRQSVQADYRLAAEFLNIRQVAVVSLQHEYGIFGGTCGSHILALLRRLRRPVVTTLHTVLRKPSDQQEVVLGEIARLSSRLVVMSQTASQILQEVYKVPPEKVAVIPHGIPDAPFVDPNFYKDQFGVEGRKVMLTFGLLGPGKGIEYAIEALPAIIDKHPEVVYIVLGATHPHVKRQTGEEYRNSLQRLVHELGLDEHVIFQNRYVEQQELLEYLGAADIYVTPYLNAEQVASGTLAYALGAGKAVISTPYWYAQEMLAEGRGRLAPFRDSRAIAEHVIDLLDNETERHAMRKAAYTYCRRMVWKNVARDYLDVFAQSRQAWTEKRIAAPARAPDSQIELPEADLRHLRLMTDDTGLVQHALYATPNRSEGYCTDDNARALIACVLYHEQTHDDSALGLMHTYLAFLANAFDERTGRFRNFLNYDRTWPQFIGSEDSHARALWGLGMGVAICPHESMIALATRLFLAGLPAADSFSSPRAWAFAVIGIHAYLKRFSGDSEVRRYRATLSERLMRRFADHMSEDWPWCEDRLAYANAKLPHALIMSGKWMQRGEMIDLGIKVLSWLIRIQTNADGMLSLVGTHGYASRDGDRARFDQQPIEAGALVDACVEAYHVTRDKAWIREARKAFNWFLGDNDLRTPLYDFTTGGCRDGLHMDRVNENQGAESTVTWLTSLLLMHALQEEETLAAASGQKVLEEQLPGPVRPSGPVAGTKVKEHARSDSDP